MGKRRGHAILGQGIEKVKDALDIGQEVTARIVKIDQGARRIGLSIKAMDMPAEEFERHQADIVNEALRPGENMVDLAGAFDEAFGSLGEEWHPGDDEPKR